ncbi:hypothetical protein O3M35_002598 [Rhynocoris fuscipes]|uniref:Uncharacterized protein n=1 Tax=Rhynocoris fuscipes TaxID=488301 RepID=A0AAW1CNE1_9HEMI
MGIQVFWPPLACLALFIAVVIMLMLRFGGRWCKLRHTAIEKRSDWEDVAYEQRVSYA